MNGIRISLVVASGAFLQLSYQMLRMEAQIILLDLVTSSRKSVPSSPKNFIEIYGHVITIWGEI